MVAVEGHSSCLGFQLAALGDVRVAEQDALFGLHRAALPLFGRVRLALAFQLDESLSAQLRPPDGRLDLRQAFERGFVNELTKVGCAFGRSIELAKSLVKFAPGALLLDRRRLLRQVFADFDRAAVDGEQLQRVLREESRPGAERFLRHGIGRGGSAQLHTLEEIYAAHDPRLFDERELLDGCPADQPSGTA